MKRRPLKAGPKLPRSPTRLPWRSAEPAGRRVNEQAAALQRTSFTSIVRKRAISRRAVFDRRGFMVAQA